MAIERIELVQLPVADLTRARDFYRRVLGTGPTVDNPDAPGGAAIFAPVGGGADLYLQLPPAPYGRPDAPIVAMQVSVGTDLAALLTEIEGAGGEIVYRESVNPDLLVVGFRDTEGNALELLIPR